MRILVVEDEPGIANFLHDGLVEEGYAVDVASDGTNGLKLALTNEYDLLLLDWMLPGMSGIELCRQVRRNERATPVILLTARDTTQDVVFGLDSGVNDYIRKPFDFDELLARIRVQLRTSTSVGADLTLGDIRIDPGAHQVYRGDKPIELTPKEFALLEFLVRNKGKVCTRTRIIEHVWDIHFDTETSVIDVYINYLRKKLNADGRPDCIHTIRGVGYLAKEPWKSLDLRNRIALIYLVSTGLLVGAVFLVIYWIAAATMERHFNDDLMAEFAEVGASMSIQDERVYVIGPHEWTEQEHGSVEMSPVFLQATDTLGVILRRSANLKNEALETVPSRRDTFLTNSVMTGGAIRQVQGPLYDHNGKVEGYLLVAVGRSEADLLLNYLRLVMILSLPVIVGIIFLISRVFGAQIVAPIRNVISTAERITDHNLEERIPAPKRQDEMYRLTTTINQLLSRIQEAVIREQQFTADAAHELRTPLAAMKGTMDVLIRHNREPQQYVEKLKYLIGEVNRISSLVDQLLTLARYESGAARPRPEIVDLAAAVRSVVNRLEPLMAEKKMTPKLSFAGNCVVTTDALMLNTILENVVSNGIKYSPEGKSVEIRIAAVPEGVECTVTDHGVGMTQEQLQRVFQRFYRADESRASSTSGAGLGLAVVKRMADLLGIKLDVTSKKDVGTTFTILFPGESA